MLTSCQLAPSVALFNYIPPRPALLLAKLVIFFRIT